MAGAKGVCEIFEDLLYCMIDFKPLTRPKLLRCGHTFCEECLSQLLVSMRRSSQDLLTIDEPLDQLKCPVCRRLTVLPESGVSGLPDNFMIEKLKECVNELQYHGTPVNLRPPSPFPSLSDSNLCNMSAECKWMHSPAKYRCHDCARNCCQRCYERHNKTFGFHKTVSFSSKTALFLHCTVHEDEYVSFYCLDCKSPQCTLCRVHNQECEKHCIVEIMDKESVVEERKSMKDQLQELKNTKEDIISTSKQLQSLRKQVYDIYADIEGEMNEARVRVLKEVERTWNKFEEERLRQRSLAEKILNVAQEEINYHELNYGSLISFIEQLLDNKENFQPLTLFQDLKSRMDAAGRDFPRLENLVCGIPIPNFTFNKVTSEIFGLVHDITVEPSFKDGKAEIDRNHANISEHSSGDGEIVDNSKSNRMAFVDGFFVPEYSDPNNTLDHFPTSVKRHANSTFYFNEDGEFIRESEGLDQTSMYNEHLELHRANPARWSSSSYISSKRHQSSSCDRLPNSAGETSADLESIRRCVSEMSLRTNSEKNKKLEKKTGKKSKSSSKKSWLDRLKTAVKSKKETLKRKKNDTTQFVSSKLLSPVQELSPVLDGKILWQTSLGKFPTYNAHNFPSGIGIYPDSGKVFVINPVRRCIDVLQNGHLVGSIHSPGLSNPACISVSHDGLVHCIDRGTQSVLIFKHDGEFVRSYSFPDFTVPLIPINIHVTHNGKVILSSKTNAYPSQVLLHICDTFGNVEASRVFPFGSGLGELMYPQCIISDGEYSVFVTDHGLGGIAVFNMHLEDSQDVLPIISPNFSPSSLCFGPNQDILVTSSESARIARLGINGAPLGELKLASLNELKKPLSLTSSVALSAYSASQDHFLLGIADCSDEMEIKVALIEFSRNSFA